jgi:3-dehydroquinate dehydratase type I
MPSLPHIIIPIRPRDFSEFSDLVKNISDKKNIRFIEIWLDQIEEYSLFFKYVSGFCKNIANAKNKLKFIAVCKKNSEKGQFMGSETERVKILQDFLISGGDFVDLDISQNTAENIRKIPRERCWLSFHDFSGKTREDTDDKNQALESSKDTNKSLEKIRQAMQKFSPSLYKFAVTIDTESHLKKFLDFAQQCRKKSSKNKNLSAPQYIFTTMGSLGIKGREILVQKQLTDYAFFALSEETRTAPGQPIFS